MRKGLALLLCLLLSGLLVLPAGAATYTASSVESEIVVDDYGLCTVQTAVVMTVPPGLDEIVLPLPENAADVTVMGYQFKQTTGNGSTVLRIASPGSGEFTFRISYTLPRAAIETAGGQALTLQLLPPDWDCTLASYSLKLTLPEPWEGTPKFHSTYYGDLADNYLTVTAEETVLTVTSLQQIEDHDALTVTLDLPDSYFRLRHLAGKVAPWAVPVFWLLALACLAYWFLRLFLRPGPIHRTSMAPEGSNAGALGHQLTGGPPDLGLMILHWATLGYLTVERQGKNRIYLVRQMEMGSERKPYETQVFHRLFAENDVCNIRSIRYRDAALGLEPKVRGYWYKKLFSRRHGGPVWVLRLLGALASGAMCLCALDRLIAPMASRWVLIIPLTLIGIFAGYLLQDSAQLPFRRKRFKGILVLAVTSLTLLAIGFFGKVLPLAVASVLLELTVGVLALPGGRRTAMGRERFFTLLGLWGYLTWTNSEEFRDLLDADGQYYYRTLLTAEALGAGRAFTKKFGGEPMEPCPWLLDGGAPVRNAEDFYPRFTETLDLLQAMTQEPKQSILRKPPLNRR